MAVTAFWYGKALAHLAKGELNWETAAVKVALFTNTYTPSQDVDEYFGDISVNEVSGATGYTAGGAALANKTILAYDAANNKIGLDADDVEWANSTITARYAVIYIDTGVPATSPLLGYVDFGQDISSTNASLIIRWDTTGIFTLSAA